MAFVTVTGTITKPHATGNGFSLLEEWKSGDNTFKKTWQVFPSTDSAPVTSGSVVTVNGVLTSSVYEYTAEDGTPGRSVSLKVNNAKIDVKTAAPEVAPF